LREAKLSIGFKRTLNMREAREITGILDLHGGSFPYESAN
jgi:hypothetical protein